MTPPRTRKSRFVLALLAVLAAELPAARAQQDDAPVEPPEAALSADPARNAEILRIAAILRLSRREDAPVRAELVKGIAKEDELETADALLDLLTAGRVPKTKDDDPRQVLSEAQSELVLGAFGALDAKRVAAACERRITGRMTAAECRAVVLALGAAGDADVLERFCRRWRARDGGELPPLRHEDWALALQRLLARAPEAFSVLESYWGEANPALQRGAIEACGELRDPRALAYLASVLERDRGDLALLAMGQVPRIGRGFEPAVEERLAESLRLRCEPNVPNVCQMALQALGELRDRSTLSLCVDWVEHDELGVRKSALWALRRATGVQLEPKTATWKRWFAEQERALERAPTTLVPKLESKDLTLVVQALRDLRTFRIERARVASWIEPVLGRTEPGLRAQACEALAELDEKSSVGALRPLLDDRDKRVASAARAALTKLVGKDVLDGDRTARAPRASSPTKG